MTVTAPPRESEIEPDGDLERRVAELEALIEEARRRRRRNGAALLLAAGAGVAAFIGFGGHGGGAGGVALADGGSGANGRTPTAAPSLGALPAVARPWGFAFDARQPNVVYVTSAHAGGSTHIYKTRDGGRHWQPTGARGAYWASDVLSLTADPVISGTLYVGTDTAIYKSVDGGDSWHPFKEGLFPGPGARVCYRLAPYTKPTCVEPPSHFGTPGETNWARNAGWVLDVAVDPADSSVVYAAAEEVRKSTDGGHTWKAMHLPYAKHWYSAAEIVVAPTRPETIYTIAHSNQMLKSTAIYKSTDAGIHWQATGGPDPDFPNSGSPDSSDALVVDPQHPETVYAAIGGAVIKTSDSGDHWQKVTNGLPPGDGSSRLSGLPAGNATSLAADPHRPGTLYAGLRRGPYKGAIYKTTDGGGSWRPIVGTDGAIYAIEINPARPATIWAVGWAGGRTRNGEWTSKPHIYRSTDRGQTWASAP